MSAVFAILMAAAAPQAVAAPQPDADQPSVPMDVAKARVAKVKTLLASATSGDALPLKDVSMLDATANFGGAPTALTVAAIAPLKSCTRNGPFTVSPYGVMVRMSCTGTLPPDATVFVNFTDEMISSVVAGPSAPAVTAPAGGR